MVKPGVPTKLDEMERKAEEAKRRQREAAEGQALCFYEVLKGNERFHSHLRVLLEVEAPMHPELSEIGERVKNGLRDAYAVIITQYRRGEQILAKRGDIA